MRLLRLTGNVEHHGGTLAADQPTVWAHFPFEWISVSFFIFEGGLFCEKSWNCHGKRQRSSDR